MAILGPTVVLKSKNIISSNTLNFVVIELASSFVGGFGSDLAGLEIYSNTKKKQVESVYSHGASYKKLKKPNTNSVLVDLSIGPLNLEDVGVSNAKLRVSWRSKVGSIANSVSSLLNVKNMVNTIAKKTNYAKSGKDNNMDKAMLRKIHIHTYVLGNLPKTTLFNIMGDDNDVLDFLLPKFTSFKQLSLAKSHAFPV
ncbi:hypothetical protein G9A89_008578 [Geosiphon pyriformis]|nr:hypothetical protein G9A89_008578 [Geosiphon pyriformis]